MIQSFSWLKNVKVKLFRHTIHYITLQNAFYKSLSILDLLLEVSIVLLFEKSQSVQFHMPSRYSCHNLSYSKIAHSFPPSVYLVKVMMMVCFSDYLQTDFQSESHLWALTQPAKWRHFPSVFLLSRSPQPLCPPSLRDKQQFGWSFVT